MKVMVGDITQVTTDVLVNAANGMGPMGGGVALAFRSFGGQVIEEEAIQVCEAFDPQEGDVYVTTAGCLNAKYILHAVTMKKPVQPAKIEVVRTCLVSLLQKCREMNIKSMAIPALGTGVGRLSKKQVAEAFVDILNVVDDIEIIVIDIDETFISLVKDALER